MNTQLIPGQTAYRQWGNLHVRIDRHDEGVSINVTHHPVLDRTFTNLDEGRAYLRLLKTEALKGTQVFLIEAMAGVLTSAAAVLDDAEQDMVDGIRANMQAAEPQPVDVSDIVDGMPVGGSWAALRRNGARDYSKGRVHRLPPTEAELGRIRAARRNPDGTLTVTRGPGQPWTVLKALHARLGGIPAYKTGTARIIETLTFPAEQLAGYLTETEAAA